MPRSLPFVLLAALLLSPSCRCSRLTPEAQVRKAIDEVIQAAREHDLGPIANAVSDHYADREQNNKQQILAQVRVQFLIRPNIYVVAKVASVDCPEPTQARVVMFAALASLPAGVVPDIRKLSADVFRFNLAMADEDGTWRVHRAAWAPATVQDLL
jgi:hypothetical protein